jgi:hypothetical protein
MRAVFIETFSEAPPAGAGGASQTNKGVMMCNSYVPHRSLVALALLFLVLPIVAKGAEWKVVIPQIYQSDEALRVALEDLRLTGHDFDVTFVMTTEAAPLKDNMILVGAPKVNPCTSAMVSSAAIGLEEIDHPQGYLIRTAAVEDRTIMLLVGGSVMGDIYGLYAIREQLRIHGEMTAINLVRKPSLQTRYTRIRVRSKEDIRRAQRYGLNLVYGDNPLRLIPWNSEPEATENAANRAKTLELATYAHALHMKFLSFGTDFTYHPSLLGEFSATLNPEDPRLWEALQEKYRRLLEALPELDGIATFTADEQQYWGNYKTFDFLHEGEGCDWNFEKRYRLFIQKLHQVVVGEFGKMLQCRTWANTVVELQSQPEVYRRIFTDEVPTKNLYLIPSFTQNDRWWFQAYNPTVNQTPHDMMIVCESMDYHAGGLLFPTFPAAYYQAGLEGMLGVPESNLKGVSMDMPGREDWQTRSLTAYCVARLAWDYQQDPGRIAEDFAAIHFGPKAAAGMAELLLKSPVAYKYGLYIEPAAHGQFCSFTHIRVGQFVAQGYNRLDYGREHLDFLRQIYLRCKPWIPETLAYLDHGLETAAWMVKEYQTVRPLIDDATLAEQVGHALDNTHWLIQCNNRYVKTFFAYFQYREIPTAENRQQLETLHDELQAARDGFAAAPGFSYKMFGVDQLLENVRQALDDLEATQTRLANALTSEEIEQIAAMEQAKYAAILKTHADKAVKVAHWRLKVDGRDVLRMQGDTLTIEHLRWDAPQVERQQVLAPLPRQEGVIVPKDLQSNALHPFVLQQPSAMNDYTAEIYCNDIPGGADWWEIELYYLPLTTEALGLRNSFSPHLAR